MERDEMPISDNNGVVFSGAVALVFWALAGLCVFAVVQLRIGVTGPGQGERIAPLLGWAILFGFGAVAFTWMAGIWAVLAAMRARDWICAVSLGVVAALATLVGYGLYHNGEPSDTVVSAIYGFSPSAFGFHPLAVPASIGIIVTMPATALAQGLVPPARVRRACCVAGLILVLALLGSIRLAG